MKITIMSREKVENYSQSLINHKVAIISISSVEDDRETYISNNENIVDVLYLKFDDHSFKSSTCMTNRDADRISEFVYKYLDEVDELVVHCLMGISRSAGVAAAITEALYGNCDHIFNSRRYEPNILCYELTYNAFLRKCCNPTRKIWEEALSIIKEQLNDVAFSLWIKPLNVDINENGVFVISDVPFRIKVVESQFDLLIKDSIEKVMGIYPKIIYKVVED